MNVIEIRESKCHQTSAVALTFNEERTFNFQLVKLWNKTFSFNANAQLSRNN